MTHKFRAKKFYQLLNEVKENEVTFCFDLMQNQELPRSPITEAYYSRQLWLYFLGVVIHREKNSEQSLDVFINGVNIKEGGAVI